MSATRTTSSIIHLDRATTDDRSGIGASSAKRLTRWASGSPRRSQQIDGTQGALSERGCHAPDRRRHPTGMTPATAFAEILELVVSSLVTWPYRTFSTASR